MVKQFNQNISKTMIFDYKLPHRNALRAAISASYRTEESACVETLLKEIRFPKTLQQDISMRARNLVEAVRQKKSKGGIEKFMLEYGLSSHEGTALMCLAESLLRVPDKKTEDKLIVDKLTSANWGRHMGHSESLFVNASTWAFMLTGKLLEAKESKSQKLRAVLTRVLARNSEPLIREAILQSMRITGRQFIMGRTIEEGLNRARPFIKRGYRLSFDMLGEAARTELDADRYYSLYIEAINTLSERAFKKPPYGHEISVKLSALEPRYEFAQNELVMDRLLSRLRALAIRAKDADIGLTVDAEEAERLELQLDLFEAVAMDPALSDWNGLGIAVQTYQKRAYYLIDWLADLARRSNQRLMVRLTKGAYWDAEIKHSQEGGLDDYPVFTRKVCTDVSYIACTQKLLRHYDVLYPMFATHNAYTTAMILALCGDYRDFEFQRLHGMGEAMYEHIIEKNPEGPLCRIYAPCGGHKELLPYLVRRLLENGANTSFVNRIVDSSIPVERIISNPIDKLGHYTSVSNPRIPLPKDLYGQRRQNSLGLDTNDEMQLKILATQMQRFAERGWKASPLINGQPTDGTPSAMFSPSDRHRKIGEVVIAQEEHIEKAVSSAYNAFKSWEDTGVEFRASCLERTADLLEFHMPELMALCICEAGKTLPNAVAEIREAVDFCRYYAEQARRRFIKSFTLPGKNAVLEYGGCGVFACISPWNFPLAIFAGQISAALVTGNTVVAKPAEQTPLIAARTTKLFHQAGIPQDVLQLITGDGEVGACLVSDQRVAGVAFTGSTKAAHTIRKSLSEGRGEIIPLIAETGGQNAMIVDSTALPDQVIADVIKSAFDSAGQRCSALRVLCLQEDIAEQTIALLAGAMQELRIGNPALLKTDVGPVIDNEALERLKTHQQHMSEQARLIHCCKLTADTDSGSYFAPCAYEINSINQLKQEHFGPFLHVLRYKTTEFNEIIDAIHATGYGLTFGLHSRIDSTIQAIRQRLRTGNIYVNRNMVGAVVGVQPFGGERLSGTGPKAGGPHYLYHFTAQHTISRSIPTVKNNITITSAKIATPTSLWKAAPVIGGRVCSGETIDIKAYDDNKRIIGNVHLATIDHAEQAITMADCARLECDQTPAQTRANALERTATALIESTLTLQTLGVLEAGIRKQENESNTRQAATLCRAYAKQCVKEFLEPKVLQGPTGEHNEYQLHNRGAFLCMGGTYQPIVALTGMIAAALAAGNPVILIPEENVLLTAAWVFSCFMAAGFTEDSLHFLPTLDKEVKEQLLNDKRLAGVSALGDPKTIYGLDAQLAKRNGPLIPLVASIKEHSNAGLFANPMNLYRLATARTTSINTTASGGNASLYCMDEEET